MLWYRDPDINSLEIGYDLEDETAYSITDMSKPLLIVYEGAGEDPFKTVNL